MVRDVESALNRRRKRLMVTYCFVVDCALGRGSGRYNLGSLEQGDRAADTNTGHHETEVRTRQRRRHQLRNRD